jgi:hypothetical protein
MVNKNTTLAIIAAVGTLLTIIFSLVGGLEPGIVIIILTVAVLAGVYFFYENPAGEECTPKSDDPNAVTYATNKIGKCVPTSCKETYYVIKDECQQPKDLPNGWTLSSSNGYTSNILATFNNVTSNAICGYTCSDTDGCNAATFSSVKTNDVTKNTCVLHTSNDTADKSVDDKVPGGLILRPKK